MGRPAASPPRTPAHGLAALTVVLALFFVLALVAAYTNRNLIFEQRMSAGSARSERAFAAAEAGVDWAIGLINGGRLSATCQLSTLAADTEFRQRFIALNGNTGGYTVVGGGTVGDRLYPGCRVSGTALSCVCPTPTNRDPTVAGGSVNDASFRVGFLTPGPGINPNETPPGTVILQVRGCANSGTGASACYKRNADPDVDAVTDVRAALGLVRALPAPPVAALTAGTTITTAAPLVAANRDNATGLAIHSGGATALAGGSQLIGPAGAAANDPGTQLADDPALAQLVVANRVFESTFALDREAFRRQPGTVRIACAGNPCRTSDLDAANWLTAYPGRVIWVPNDLVIDTVPAAGATAGTDTAPLMLVVNGNLDIRASVDVVGFVYANNISWNDAAATVRGAVMAANAFTASTAATLTYDAPLLRLIQLSYGSFVRVPGGWTRGRYL